MKCFVGFTLTEIMIAISVIAILGCVAYPTYLYHIHVGRRADAHTSLEKISSLQEQYFLYHGKYVHIQNLNNSSRDDLVNSENGFYQIDAIITDKSYILTAIAKGSQWNDAQCRLITLDNTGRKGGTSGQACW